MSMLEGMSLKDPTAHRRADVSGGNGVPPALLLREGRGYVHPPAAEQRAHFHQRPRGT